MKRRPVIIDLATHDREFVTPPQLARAVECDVRTIRRMIETGALPAYRVGRDWRILTADACSAFRVKQHKRTSQYMSGTTS